MCSGVQVRAAVQLLLAVSACCHCWSARPSLCRRPFPGAKQQRSGSDQAQQPEQEPLPRPCRASAIPSCRHKQLGSAFCGGPHTDDPAGQR